MCEMDQFKYFLKSVYKANTGKDFTKAEVMYSVNTKRFVAVDLPEQKPCCLDVITFLQSQDKFSEIKLSKIFGMVD